MRGRRLVLFAALGFIVAASLTNAWLLIRPSRPMAAGEYGSSTAPTEAGSRVPRIEDTDCWFEKPPDRDVRCGRLIVPEDWSTMSGREVAIRYVVFPAPSEIRQPDPVLFISGGPGEPAFIDRGGIARWSELVSRTAWLRDRDLVLYDQRGVGVSEPRLTCPEVAEAGAGIFIEALGHEEAAIRWRTAAQRCYERLLGEGHRLDRYNTAAHVRDASALLERLGYGSWNIVAVSYGTRIAANLLRQEEKSVRSIVLDSVLPADARAYLETADNAARAFERLAEHCAAEPKCNAQAPKLLENIFAALERAGKAPLTVPIPRQGKKPLRVSLDDAKLAEVLMYAFYDAGKTRELPAAITAVSRGELRALAPFAQQALDTYTSAAISHGLFFSVICSDEFPFNEPQDVAKAADRSGLLKQFALADLGLVACPAWPVGAADGSARLPVASDAPVLILSGDLDPATPPEYASRVAATLTSARIYKFPWIGHGVIGAHECADKLVADFLADPRAAKLDECGAPLSVQR